MVEFKYKILISLTSLLCRTNHRHQQQEEEERGQEQEDRAGTLLRERVATQPARRIHEDL